MKNSILLLICFFSLGKLIAQEQEPDYDFDHLRLNIGNVLSKNVENDMYQKPGLGLGLSAEGTFAENYFMGTSLDFNLANKKLIDCTIDLGGGKSAYVDENTDLFLGLCLFSMNINVYDQSPFNSAVFLKFRYKKIFYESKMTVWGWRSGHDPVFRMNSYYGLAYKISDALAINLTYKLYSPEAKFMQIGFGWLL